MVRDEDPSAQAAERLRAAKKLLDDGVLTQAEFDAKKKELMERI
jgi:hypothetical protein